MRLAVALFAIVLQVYVTSAHSDEARGVSLEKGKVLHRRDEEDTLPEAEEVRETYLPHEKNCQLFYIFEGSEGMVLTCRKGHLFDANLKKCAKAKDVKCGERRKPKDSSSSSSSEESEEDIPKFKCPKHTINFPHRYYCNLFYECVNKVKRLLQCPTGSVFDEHLGYCQSRDLVDCENRMDPYKNHMTEDGGVESDYAPSICPKTTGIFPHPTECDKFLRCWFGVAYVDRCPRHYLFDAYWNRCLAAVLVDCKDRKNPYDDKPTPKPTTTPSPTTPKEVTPFEPTPKPFVCPSRNGKYPDEYDCSIFHDCKKGKHKTHQCPRKFLYCTKKKRCEAENEVDCGTRVHPDDDPHAQPDKIVDPNPDYKCKSRHGKDTHRKYCDWYYHCKDKKATIKECKQGFYFDSRREKCRKDKEVDCRGRITPEERERPTTTTEVPTTTTTTTTEVPTTTTTTTTEVPTTTTTTTTEVPTTTTTTTTEVPTTTTTTTTEVPTITTTPTTVVPTATQTESPSPKTEEPSTEKPATESPTPETEEPSTIKPTTESPTPETEEPSTVKPTTESPTPETEEPSTVKPTTESPTPETEEPSTVKPATESPTPETEETSTVKFITESPTPETEEPSTVEPTTESPTPETEKPSTVKTTAESPSPKTEEPSTVKPTTESPSPETEKPSTVITESPSPKTEESSTVKPITDSPSPKTEESTTGGTEISSTIETATVERFVCGEEDGNYVHNDDCSLFYRCWNGVATIHKCPKGQLFHSIIRRCYREDWVYCENRKRPEIDVTTGTGPTTTESPIKELCSMEDGDFHHPTDCKLFYRCKDGFDELLECPDGTLFDNGLRECFDEDHVNCGDRQRPTTTVHPCELWLKTSSKATSPMTPATEGPTLPPITGGKPNSTEVTGTTEGSNITENATTGESAEVTETDISKEVTNATDIVTTTGDINATESIGTGANNVTDTEKETTNTTETLTTEDSTQDNGTSTIAESSTGTVTATISSEVETSGNVSTGSNENATEVTKTETFVSSTETTIATDSGNSGNGSKTTQEEVTTENENVTSANYSTPDEISSNTTMHPCATYTPKPSLMKTPPQTHCKKHDLDCIIEETGDIKEWFTCPVEYGMFPHPSSDMLFIYCFDGVPSARKCAKGLVFSPEYLTCVLPGGD